jgi:hypothetical protein
MALYSAGVVTPAAAASAAYTDLRAHASSDRPYLKRLEITVNAATASSIGLYRSATAGTASTTVVGVAHEPANPAGTALVGTAWSSAPTISSNVPLRRIVTPATAGYPIIWDFVGMEIAIPVGGTLVLWNFGTGAGSVLHVEWTWDE